MCSVCVCVCVCVCVYVCVCQWCSQDLKILVHGCILCSEKSGSILHFKNTQCILETNTNLLINGYLPHTTNIND